MPGISLRVRTSSPDQSPLSSPSSTASLDGGRGSGRGDMYKTTTQPTYFISPHTLRLKDCRCDLPRRKLSSAPEYIQYMLHRLRKVTARLTGDAHVPGDIEDAALRIMYELRGRGYELFHLVSWAGEVTRYANGKVRQEFNVAFLVPDPRAGSGHRIVGEIAIRSDESKHGCTMGFGKLDNVGTRTYGDWEDWSVAQAHSLVWDESKKPRETRRVRGEEGLRETVWAEVLELEPGCVDSKKEFGNRIDKVTTRLREDGQRVFAYDANLVFRQSSDGRRRMPVIRIALHARDWKEEESKGQMEAEQGMKSLKLGQGIKSLQQDQHQDLVAAVFLVNLTPSPSGQKVKHMAVVYKGEWPLSHHYRRNTPKPDMVGLESMVVD